MLLVPFAVMRLCRALEDMAAVAYGSIAPSRILQAFTMGTFQRVLCACLMQTR